MIIGRVKLVEPKSKQNCLVLIFAFVDNMREVIVSNVIVIEILDREISKHTSVGELMTCEVDFSANICIMNKIFSPRRLPLLSLETNRERPSHLNRSADWQVRSSFMVEESKHLIIEIN